ncbi:AAA-like domain-containing protein [Pleurocapsa sp. PCC 7319]|uniref:AAA-like domain-containing protein n=1 Tax=Pleurocapsa sp. PCC 7319 TaxID=118161 RepID=UPI00034A7A8D|nr:AAA-like domain-containing protein [Pleurocapsa sp. PCC 7319]
MFDFYKVGGSLRYGHPTYIQRQADRDIYIALKQKEFCYVLNSRQMGKSSLRVRTMKTLANEGFKCVAIDLGILGRFTTAEQWYGGLVAELWRRLRLSNGMDDDLNWWRSHLELPPVQRFSRFIEDILLVNCTADIIVFLDEVDNIINLDFRDEFLILIRDCYEKRVEQQQYRRLTFCLLGVATPSSLRINKQLSPFNIGRAIQLTGFNFTEAQPLISGLAGRFSQPEAILKDILSWTKGQPFLTQKLCSLIVRSAEEEPIYIPQLIQHRLVDNWEIQDEPEHLRTIRDRLLHNQNHKARLLTVYQQILKQEGITIDGSDEQVELRLSGLVTSQEGKLKVSNPIYERVFNQQWVSQQLFAMSPFQDAIAAWLKSQRQDRSRLLRGTALAEGQTWARKHSISSTERKFLQASETLAVEEQRQAKLAQKAEQVARQLAQKKRLVRWQRLFILFSLAMITGFYLKSRQANVTSIANLVQSSEALFASEQKLDALIAAIKAKQQLQKSWRVNQNLTQQVDAALQQAVYEIEEYDRLLGHSDRLYGLAISNDGKLMASTATDQTVRLWIKKSSGWQFSQELTGHQGWVLDVAISPNGNTIASGSRDRTVKLWSQTGKLLDTLQHQQPVTSVAFDHNNRVISGTEDGEIAIWQQGKPIQTLTEHTAAVEAIAISPKGEIISASEDKTLKIWRSGKVIKTLRGHTEGVRDVAITPDGTKIISGSRDKTLKIWDIKGTQIATLRGHLASVYGVAVNPLNNQIVSASADQTLKIWGSNGTEISTLRGHTNRIWDVAYTANGHIASASWDKTIRLWQPENDLKKVLSGHQDVAIALDYDSNIIASASDDKTVKLWDKHGTLLKTWRGHSAEVYDVAINDQTIATVGADKTLKIWQPNSNVVNTINAHKSSVWAVDLSSDGTKILTAGNDSIIKIWDIDGNLLHQLKGHLQKVWDVAISPQDKYLVSGSEDNTVKLWDLQGNFLDTLEGHEDAVRAVAISADGNLVISGSEDRSIKIWNRKGKIVTTLEGHQAAVKGVAIGRDNQYLASVDDDGKIFLWQQYQQTWQHFKILQGHDSSLWSVAFSPDGQTLATAGEDSQVILWNLDKIFNLDPLEYGCQKVKNYLFYLAEIDPKNRHVCHE